MEQILKISYRWLAFVALVPLTATVAPAEEMRTWRYRDTGIAFRAELTGMSDGQLQLRREENGEPMSIAPERLSLADLQFAYQRLQQPFVAPTRVEQKKPAKSTQPESVAASGSYEVEVECWKPLAPDVVQQIKDPLLAQLASAAPFPANTITTVQLKLEIRNQNVETFRLGKHSYVITDRVAEWRIVVVRQNPKSRRSKKSLHSEKLEVTGVEALGEPPQTAGSLINKIQLSNLLHAAAMAKIRAWRIPDGVIAADN